MTAPVAGCPLCEGPGGRLVLQTPRWRLIHASEPGFPAFYRVVWNEHVAEFSDLPAQDRAECLDAVVAVEEALRRRLAPAKVNLATLGNVVPHLHWHVIARFADDSHFPGPVWAPAQRAVDAARCEEISSQLPALEHELVEVFGRRA